MSERKRKPSHPGIILDELYIKPLNLNLQELAENLGISRNSLFKIRTGKASISPSLAVCLAEAFDTTPNLWLNLQQNFDIWVEENEKFHKPVIPLYKSHRAIIRRSKKTMASS
jgi:addiction module HigA family antidote